MTTVGSAAVARSAAALALVLRHVGVADEGRVVPVTNAPWSGERMHGAGAGHLTSRGRTATLREMSTRLPLIACSLDAEGQKARLADWASVLGQAAVREETKTGVRYSFAGDSDFEAQLRTLAAAEHSCCSFLDFDVIRADDQLELTVTAPLGGVAALRFIFSA